ncbi:hypothetical protein [Seonamhaeicola maritimus]|uniref:Uncharacterized protein n=1 Tax=Seonamhaeicola maritimus TaxID=2591822 RepID=A0A5C7GEJ9_9FLAO|nr:hypothetical protein [Seonamhaeicola maritimus]TXG35273.1 hypothetical protein FUA22_16120 [Seonamhaeicola maritimus]
MVNILLFVLIFSCKNESAYKLESTDVENEVVEINKPAEFSEIDNYETLSAQKLSEYFDLLKLKSQHPDFEEDIVAQLKNYTSEQLIGFKINDDFEIQNIRLNGEQIKIADTLRKLQIEFDINSKFVNIKDSVFAYITSNTILVDGKELKSNKVRFSRE